MIDTTTAPVADNTSVRFRPVLIPTAASVILILTGLVLFGSAGRDDSHLTYWPAHTLATSGHIVNYNGDRIEQSSSVLHVATLAALHRMTTLDVVTIGTLFSVAMGGAAVLALFFLVRRTASVRRARPA